MVCNMINVELRLLGELRRLLPEKYRESGSTRLAAPDGVTTAELLDMAGMAVEGTLAVLVNGRYAEPGLKLADGDVVSVFPPVARR